MKTRIIILSILISLFSSNIFAQSDRESLWLVRVNGSYHFHAGITPSHKVVDKTKGFSVDFGKKIFILHNKGWFIESNVNIYHCKLPYYIFSSDAPPPITPIDLAVDYISNNSNELILGWDAKESGLGTSVRFGYDFKLYSNISLEVFSGPEFRFAFNFDPNSESINEVLNRFYFRWQAGVGVNYWRFNLNCTFSTDMYNRGKCHSWGKTRYRLNYLSVGLAYRFGL